MSPIPEAYVRFLCTISKADFIVLVCRDQSEISYKQHSCRIAYGCETEHINSFACKGKGKGKSVPLQAWSGPKGSS